MRHRKNILKTAAAVIIISLTVSANTGFAYAQESAAVTEQAAEETSDGSAGETSADSYTANTTDDAADDPAGQPADPAEQNTDDQSADAAGENTAGQTADAAGENTDEQTAEDAGENTAGRTEENAAGQTERSTAGQTQDPSEETSGTSDEDGESSGEQNPAYTLTRLVLSDEELTYTGEALTKAEVLVYGTKSEAASGTASGAASEENEFLLIKDTDYTIEYSGNVNAGTAQVTVTGIGSYEGQTLTESFEILPAAITDISLKYASMTYTGKPRTQSKTTEVRCGKTILQRGTDYTISYTGNVEPGTAEMTVTGSGNYTGSITKTFTIRAKLAEVVLKYSSLKYTGKARTQTGTTKVTAKIGGETRVLTRGTDYKISYKNNTNAGTATMTITGIGSYKGTLKKKFKIAPVSLKSASISASSELYTGKAITTTAKVKAKVAGETVTLKQDRDYTISYKKNKKVGTATAVIKGKGNFKGTIKKTFEIVAVKLTGSGTKRRITASPLITGSSARVAVWSRKSGQDDLRWIDLKMDSNGNWKATISLASLKDYGKVYAHVYSDSTFVCEKTFKVSHADWLTARSDDFKSRFLYKSGNYINIDYVQCAVNIANNNYFGYGHTWRYNGHTISCAGLVGLALTSCGYGDFIKDDPVERLDGGRWGYLDLGTYSSKYNWTDIMKNEVGATWHAGLSGIEPGDILYYDYGIYNNHCAIYLGNGVTVEARGPSGSTDNDDSGAEVSIYGGGLSGLPWQGYFSIPDKHYI